MAFFQTHSILRFLEYKRCLEPPISGLDKHIINYKIDSAAKMNPVNTKPYNLPEDATWLSKCSFSEFDMR